MIPSETICFVSYDTRAEAEALKDYLGKNWPELNAGSFDTVEHAVCSTTSIWRIVFRPGGNYLGVLDAGRGYYERKFTPEFVKQNLFTADVIMHGDGLARMLERSWAVRKGIGTSISETGTRPRASRVLLLL